jgi:polysaccharide biosynthesis protein PslH
MRILFLSQVLPYPPDSGPKIRSYYVLRYLAKLHRVTLVSFVRATDPPEAIDHLLDFCERVITVPIQRSRIQDLLAFMRSLYKHSPMVIERDLVPAMQTAVNDVLDEGNFHAVHCDQLWMAQYALLAQAPSGEKHPMLFILDEHNACFQIFKRLARGETNSLKRLVLEREWRLLKRYERQACRKFNQVVTVSQADRSILSDLLTSTTPGRPTFSTIPIGVDIENTPPVTIPSDNNQVLHLGTMFWPPNVEGVLWFIEKIWPRVQAAIPQAQLIIAGKTPPRSILRSSQEPSNRIRVTGYVSDPQTLLKQAGVFIVPLLSGSGMRVKILDAWKWGLPVVSTRLGAEGISYEPGKHIFIADSAQEFAEAVIGILQRPDLSESLRRNGRTWVERTYDWKNIYPAWGDIYPSSSSL